MLANIPDDCLQLISTLSDLTQTLCSASSLDEVLEIIARKTVQLLELDRATIMLMEQNDKHNRATTRRLTVRASVPPQTDQLQRFSVDIDGYLFQQLRTMQSSTLYAANSNDNENKNHLLERLQLLKETQYQALLSAPIIFGGEYLGLLNGYSYRKRFGATEQSLLYLLANQTAMVIKNRALQHQLSQKNLVREFFEDLTSSSHEHDETILLRAHYLGCDLSLPHAPLNIELAPLLSEGKQTAATLLTPARVRRLANTIQRSIYDAYQGSLVYEHENLLTCIVQLNNETSEPRLQNWLEEFAQKIALDQGIMLSIGIGNTCYSLHDYHQGLTEAHEALHLGQSLQQEGFQTPHPHAHITHFNDLGVYRYLYKIAYTDDLRDIYQDQIALVSEYDQRKQTNLLITLETYLESAGNVTRTAERLFVHRNTLLQRLERLQSLCTLPIQERTHWLALQIAIKIYKLRLHLI